MLKLDLRFYDREEEAKFKSWSRFQKIASIMNGGLNVDENEILIYSLFDEQRDSNEWRTYADMKRHVPSRESAFRDYFDLSNGSIRYKMDGQPYRPMVEKVGVAVSLVAANGIFGLHAADWTSIPPGNKQKSLDFMYASSGLDYVEVESKGSVVDDVELKSSSISHQKKDILEKKTQQCGLHPNRSNTLLFGSIAAIPRNGQQRAVVWLVDPPGDPVSMDPRKFRILTRMRFYLKWMRMISQSAVIAVLRNRIEAISVSSEYQDLDGVALLGPAGSSMRFRGGASFRRKAKIGRQVVGRVMLLDELRVIFFGLDVEVYRMMVRQKFEEIVNYRSSLSEAASRPSTVEAFLEEQEFEGRNPEDFGATWSEEEKRYRLTLRGPVLFDGSGLALGIIGPKLPHRGNVPTRQGGPASEGETLKRLQRAIDQGSLDLVHREKVAI